MSTRHAQPYKPLYFLSVLGMGGLSVSFFMYLMFLVEHPTTPVPTFESLQAVFTDGSVARQVMVVLALIGIAWFAFRHIQLLIVNLRAHAEFRRTPEYEALRNSNAEVSLMAIPLTLGMTMNTLFILGALAIPGLWDAIEYVLPVALVGFIAIGVLAFVIFGRYLSRVISHKGFNIEDTNHFSQVLPSFTFTMLAVGFAAPAAMSRNTATSVIAMIGAFMFLAAAAGWILVKLPVSFGSILRSGMAKEAGPTLWMGIPIFTLVGITFIRLGSGVSHNILDTTLPPVLAFIVLGLLVAGQIVMGLGGLAVMRRQGYFAEYVRGPKASIPSYGLICPGVAFAVLTMFFIHWGLVKTDVVAMWSPMHFALLAVVAVTQLVTIVTMAQLNRKLYGSPAAATSVTPQPELASAV